MGRIRKALSATSFGVVRWSNASERTAKEAKRARRLAEEQLAVQRAALAQQQHVPPPPPPGWYVDQANQAQLRWWDGCRWTSACTPRV